MYMLTFSFCLLLLITSFDVFNYSEGFLRSSRNTSYANLEDSFILSRWNPTVHLKQYHLKNANQDYDNSVQKDNLVLYH